MFPFISSIVIPFIDFTNNPSWASPSPKLIKSTKTTSCFKSYIESNHLTRHHQFLIYNSPTTNKQHYSQPLKNRKDQHQPSILLSFSHFGTLCLFIRSSSSCKFIKLLFIPHSHGSLILFLFIFTRPKHGFKIVGKIISPNFQSINSHTFHTNLFSILVFTYWLSKILIFSTYFFLTFSKIIQ